MLARLRVERPSLQGETLGFMQRLWGLAHALDVRSKRMARRLGVTGPQRLVIRLLALASSTPGELAETLDTHPSTLSGILERLEKQGLLRREPDPDDGRRTQCVLTKAGQAIDRERKGTVEAAVRRALARADKRDITSTIRVLELLTLELERDD